MERYAELGADLAMVSTLAPDPVDFVERLGEKVIPRLARIGG